MFLALQEITMSSLLADLSLVATELLKQAVQVVTTVTSNPLLLLVSGIMFFGAAVGIFGRLLSRG